MEQLMCHYHGPSNEDSAHLSLQALSRATKASKGVRTAFPSNGRKKTIASRHAFDGRQTLIWQGARDSFPSKQGNEVSF